MKLLVVAIMGVLANGAAQNVNCFLSATNHRNSCNIPCRPECRLRVSGNWGNRGAASHNNVHGPNNSGNTESYGGDWLGLSVLTGSDCRGSGSNDWRGGCKGWTGISQYVKGGTAGRQNQDLELNCQGRTTLTIGITDTDWGDNEGGAQITASCPDPETWTDWTEWGACDAGCGAGESSKTRTCTKGGVACPDTGKPMDVTRPCYAGPCAGCEAIAGGSTNSTCAMLSGNSACGGGHQEFRMAGTLYFAPCKITGGTCMAHTACAVDDLAATPAPAVPGCSDDQADNFNADATEDDGSCSYPTAHPTAPPSHPPTEPPSHPPTEPPSHPPTEPPSTPPVVDPTPAPEECDQGSRNLENPTTTQKTAPSDCQEFCMEDNTCVWWSMTGADCSIAETLTDDTVTPSPYSESGDTDCEASTEPLPVEPTDAPTEPTDPECGWLDANGAAVSSGKNKDADGFQCKDKHFCDGGNCCKCNGGRWRCPDDFPEMCAGGVMNKPDYYLCAQQCVGPFGAMRDCPNGVFTGHPGGEFAADAPECAPVTDAPTDPATDAPTDPATDAPTDPATDAPTDPATDAPTEDPEDCTMNQGMKFTGGTVTGNPIEGVQNWESCARYCDKRTDCIGFLYKSDKRCFRYSSVGSGIEAHSDSSVVSGSCVTPPAAANCFDDHRGGGLCGDHGNKDKCLTFFNSNVIGDNFLDKICGWSLKNKGSGKNKYFNGVTNKECRSKPFLQGKKSVQHADFGACQGKVPEDAVTDAPTDPATDAPTDPATDAPTDPATDAPTDPATDAPTEEECNAGSLELKNPTVVAVANQVPSDCQEFCMEDATCVWWSLTGMDCSLAAEAESEEVTESIYSESGDNACDASETPLPTEPAATDAPTDAPVCEDDPNFTDKDGSSCADWTGYDCSAAHVTYGFTEQGQADLVASCCDTCTPCVDNDDFKDEQNWDCNFWGNYVCEEATSKWLYTPQGQQDILDNCCFSCSWGNEPEDPNATPVPVPAPEEHEKIITLTGCTCMDKYVYAGEYHIGCTGVGEDAFCMIDKNSCDLSESWGGDIGNPWDYCVYDPPTDPATDAPTDPATDPPTEGTCRDFDGDKKGCKKAGVIAGKTCSWNKADDTCKGYACADFQAKGEFKGPKKAKKMGLTCFWNIQTKTLAAASIAHIECKEYKKKKSCKKTGGKGGAECKWPNGGNACGGPNATKTPKTPKPAKPTKAPKTPKPAKPTKAPKTPKPARTPKPTPAPTVPTCAMLGGSANKCLTLSVTFGLECAYDKTDKSCADKPAVRQECVQYNGKPGKCGKEGCTYVKGIGACV